MVDQAKNYHALHRKSITKPALVFILYNISLLTNSNDRLNVVMSREAILVGGSRGETGDLFDGDGLGEVPRLIDVTAPFHGNFIGEQLHGH